MFEMFRVSVNILHQHKVIFVNNAAFTIFLLISHKEICYYSIIITILCHLSDQSLNVNVSSFKIFFMFFYVCISLCSKLSV